MKVNFIKKLGGNIKKINPKILLTIFFILLFASDYMNFFTLYFSTLNISNWIAFLSPIAGLVGIYYQLEKQKIKKNTIIITDIVVYCEEKDNSLFNCIIEHDNYASHMITLKNLTNLNIININISIENNDNIEKENFHIFSTPNGKWPIIVKNYLTYNDEFKFRFPSVNCIICFEFLNEFGITQIEKLQIKPVNNIIYITGFNEESRVVNY